MKQIISVYGFGSAFDKNGSGRDIDLLIVHEDSGDASCKFAIACKEKLSESISSAHITMLSKREEAHFRFRQIARAKFLGTIREDDLNADIALQDFVDKR